MCLNREEVATGILAELSRLQSEVYLLLCLVGYVGQAASLSNLHKAGVCSNKSTWSKALDDESYHALEGSNTILEKSIDTCANIGA